jgi:hypothetical protein
MDLRSWPKLPTIPLIAHKYNSFLFFFFLPPCICFRHWPQCSRHSWPPLRCASLILHRAEKLGRWCHDVCTLIPTRSSDGHAAIVWFSLFAPIIFFRKAPIMVDAAIWLRISCLVGLFMLESVMEGSNTTLWSELSDASSRVACWRLRGSRRSRTRSCACTWVHPWLTRQKREWATRVAGWLAEGCVEVDVAGPPHVRESTRTEKN